MPTRNTHARIYQGEFTKEAYESIHNLADQNNIPVRDFILESIREYLNSWDPSHRLDFEEVFLNDASARLYLWMPYEICDELNRLMDSRGTYVQALLKRALKKHF